MINNLLPTRLSRTIAFILCLMLIIDIFIGVITGSFWVVFFINMIMIFMILMWFTTDHIIDWINEGK